MGIEVAIGGLMSYSRIFKFKQKDVIDLTRELARVIWKGTDQEKYKFSRLWLAYMSEVDKIPLPALIYIDSDELRQQTGGGIYNNNYNVIILSKWSLVTLIHEYRHAVQHAREMLEEDARAWSVSLFRRACPKAYRRAVEKGILHFH